MGVEYESPKIEKADSPVHNTVETHPAYAQISASRVQGRTNLYGSDFDHHHYMTISISKSELHRGLSRDWPFAREEYIEVALSEAQWASFVSSPNCGQGVQCTLNHKDRHSIPQIPSAPKRQHQFKMEVDARLENALTELSEVRKAIEESKLSGTAKKEILNHLMFAERDFSSNIAFVASQFGEHMEGVTEKAKTEVNAYITATIMRSGIEALKGTAPILIQDKSQ